MKTITLLFTLALSITSVKGACAQNWITDAFGIVSMGDPANNNDPVVGDNTFATCSSIRAGANTCCLKTAVATFQSRVDELVTALNTSVITRDQWIMDRRGDVLNVNDAMLSILDSVEKLSNQPGASLGGSLTAFLSVYQDLMTVFTSDLATLKDAYITYQTDRVNCFNNLIYAQVALWCAACSDSLANVGLDTDASEVTYGSIFTGAVASACSSYINGAIAQSQILSLYQISDYVSTLASALEKLLSGDNASANEEFIEFFNALQDLDTPSDNLEKIAYSVGTCTTTSCPWITETLFNSGILDRDLAVIGGSDVTLSRRLESRSPAGRLLQGALNVDPATETDNIAVDFWQNPGSIDNDSNSAVRNSAIICAITVLVSLF